MSQTRRNKELSELRRQGIERHGFSMDPNGVLGSLRALHPTHARFDETKPSTTQYVRYQWRSRDNRKGKFFYRTSLIVFQVYDHLNYYQNISKY